MINKKSEDITHPIVESFLNGMHGMNGNMCIDAVCLIVVNILVGLKVDLKTREKIYDTIEKSINEANLRLMEVPNKSMN